MRSKVSRPVLRGLGDSNVSRLPGEYLKERIEPGDESAKGGYGERQGAALDL